MAISLQKGGNVSLSKEAPGLNQVKIGLGWDVRVTDGQPHDLDASVFLVAANGKVRSDADFIFYNQMCFPRGSATYNPPEGTSGARLQSRKPDNVIAHTGDNTTGEGEGDDEMILVALNLVPPDIQKIVVIVTIHDAAARGNQNFGQVSSAFIRIVDINGVADYVKGGTEIARFDLAEDASTNTALIFGELYRHGNEWKFRAVSEGSSGGLAALAKNYGVNL